MKKVSFEESKNKIHFVDSHCECRIRYWEFVAVDRMRFDRKIENWKRIISPVLNLKHRLNVFNNRFK